MTSKMVDYSSHDSPYISLGQQGEDYSPSIVDIKELEGKYQKLQRRQ